MKRWGRFLVSLLAVFALAACASSSGKLVKQVGGKKTKPDQVAERFISLSHRSGERVSLTYYRKGTYDAEAMRKIEALFKDRTTGAVGDIDPELIDFMVDIRTRLGLPPAVVFEVLSGYRSSETNAKLRDSNKQVAKESLHIHGWAVDFRIQGVSGSAIAEIAKTMQRGGVSFYPSSNHVHVDLGNIRTWKTK